MSPPEPPAMDDAELAEFGGWLRSELTPVEATPARAASVRRQAHAELRRASDPPLARTRRNLLRLAETSGALAVGASYVVWVMSQLWRR